MPSRKESQRLWVLGRKGHDGRLILGGCLVLFLLVASLRELVQNDMLGARGGLYMFTQIDKAPEVFLTSGALAVTFSGMNRRVVGGACQNAFL